MRKRLLLIAMACSLGSASAASILNETFEGYFPVSPAGPQTSAGVINGTAFSLLSGTVDVNNSNFYGQLCSTPAVTTCIDTTGGGTGPRGVIETTNGFNFAAGTQYMLTFSLVRWNDAKNGFNAPAGPQNTKVQVTIGTLYNETFTVDGSYTDGKITRLFTPISAVSGAKLRFSDLGSSDSVSFAGAILDNITLDSVTGVPEPSTYALVGIGASIIAFARRKRS